MSLPRRSELLANAAISTTALAPIEARLPGLRLTWIMWAYLVTLRTLTRAHNIELYATPAQQQALDKLGLRKNLVAYHVPWEKRKPHLTRLLETPQPVMRHATVHMYEWQSAVHYAEHQYWPNPAQAIAGALEIEPAATEIALLDRASANNVMILFETVVDREFYTELSSHAISREAYMFRRLDAVSRLRDVWIQHYGDRAFPAGVVLNPWHLSMEARGPELLQELRSGVPASVVRDGLLSLLLRAYDAAGGLVRRIYVGNSRSWELRLPEALQRGHVLDAKGLIPEMPLLAHMLQFQPELVDAITLEVAPQAALFGGAVQV